MAVSQIEEKILGRLAHETEPENALLSASLYQVLGLSILLSRKLFRARKVRKLDTTRDTKSLQLYHHIIWLAREGLSITEVYILPYCQDGERGPECQVMAAKLRASLYHVFCLFHNHPPVSTISSRSSGSPSPPSSGGKSANGQQSPGRSSRSGAGQTRRKPHLRDPIPSTTSGSSYVTNPYALPAQMPPPSIPPPPIPTDQTRKTPTRPPGLNVPSPRTFLLPPLNFVPMARAHFHTARTLADSVLPAAHALRLSISLEHSAFIWDCEKEHERARKLARKTIKGVYSSAEGLDDDEFADASALVQALAGIVKRGNEMKQRSADSLRRGSDERLRSAPQQIDRTISTSPSRSRRKSPAYAGRSAQHAYVRRTPDRLSTVPEVDSAASEGQATQPPFSPSISMLSSRASHQRQAQTGTPSSAASDKAAKRRAVERAEEEHLRRNSLSSQRSDRHESDRKPVQRKPVSPRKSSKTESKALIVKESSQSSIAHPHEKHNSKRGRQDQESTASKSSRRRRSSRGSTGSKGSKSSHKSESGHSSNGSRRPTPEGPRPPASPQKDTTAWVGIGGRAAASAVLSTTPAQDRREAVLRALEIISAAAISSQPERAERGQGNRLVGGIWRLV